jgi:methionyl-tRNA formyltransferase
VLLTRERTIGARETSGDLFASLAVLGGEALVEALDRLEDGHATFTPQDPARATYARKIRKERGALDWTKPAVELERAVRAFNPWPLARFCDPKGRELNLLAAQVVERDDSSEPGTVLEAGPRFVVACGQGALELLEVQAAGKRALPAAEFLRGARMVKGEKVGTPPTHPK